MRYSVYIVFLLPFTVFAQVDSVSNVYQLEEVEIEGTRSQNFSTGQRALFADSINRANRTSYSLAEQLQYGNTNFIRSYGSNGLATLSLQGSSDVHSAVVWNGFNLQSVMNGTFDLSLFPVFFTDEVGVQNGSASNLWGSGAVGGTVQLNNKPQFEDGIRVKSNSEVGSYGQFRQQLKVGYGNKGWFGSLRGYYSEAKNDYPVEDVSFSSKLSHAATKQKGALAENYFKWKNNFLACRLWLQDNYRETPFTERNGTIFHNFRRGNVEFQKNGQKLQWHSRAAWLREDIYYLDPERTENTKSLADAWIGETELRWRPTPRHLAQLGTNVTHQQSSIEVYNYGPLGYVISPDPMKYERGNPTRDLMAFFGFYKYTSLDKKFSWQASLRQEFLKNISVPLVPATGAEYSPWRWVLLKAQASRSFRIPTFNELYWKPGGNPQLMPESGWNAEISARLILKNADIHAYYEIALFRRQMKNWIRWIPTGSFWSAQNVAEVRTEGIEHRAVTEFRKGKSSVKVLAAWSYISSINQRSALENDQSVGLQLIFMPLYQGNGSFRYTFGGFHVEYNHLYTGYVYHASDHSQWLVPFHLGNVILSQWIPFKKIMVAAVFRVNNLWDTRYRTVAAYPMPPRHFTAGISFEFHKPNN